MHPSLVVTSEDRYHRCAEEIVLQFAQAQDQLEAINERDILIARRSKDKLSTLDELSRRHAVSRGRPRSKSFGAPSRDATVICAFQST
jgi:hypothetical protein